MTGRAGHFGLLLDPSTDPNIGNVSALLHLDGADGSTSFPDVKGKVWTPGGSAQVDTAQSKFGGASLGLGTAVGAGGGWLSTPSHADFAYGTGDFTWEAWVRRIGTASNNEYVFDHGANGGVLFVTSGTTRLGYYNSSTGLSGQLYNPTNPAAVLGVNVWRHVAVARQAGTTRMFVDGTMVASQADTYNFAAQQVYIGRYGGIGNYWNGWIDEARITKGIARYTANFTPPAAPFPDA